MYTYTELWVEEENNFDFSALSGIKMNQSPWINFLDCLISPRYHLQGLGKAGEKISMNKKQLRRTCSVEWTLGNSGKPPFILTAFHFFCLVLFSVFFNMPTLSFYWQPINGVGVKATVRPLYCSHINTPQDTLHSHKETSHFPSFWRNLDSH